MSDWVRSVERKECGVEEDHKNSPKGHGYVPYLDCVEGSQMKTFVEIHQIGIGWGWGSEHCGCRTWGGCSAAWDLGFLCGRLTPGPVWPRARREPRCREDGVEVISMGDDLLCTPKVDPPRPHPRHTRLSVALCCVVSRVCLSLWIGKYGGAIDARASFSLPWLSAKLHTWSLRVESRLLQPCHLTWWVFQSASGPVFPCRTQGLGCQRPACSPGWGVHPYRPSPPYRAFPGLQVPTQCFFLCPTWLHGDLSCSFGCIRVFLPISSWFSVRIVPHISVFLMCCAGGKLHVLPLHHLGSPPQVYFSNWI